MIIVPVRLKSSKYISANDTYTRFKTGILRILKKTANSLGGLVFRNLKKKSVFLIYYYLAKTVNVIDNP